MMRFWALIFLFCASVSNLLAQNDPDIREHMRRVTDKAYIAENLIIGNTNRINYLLQVLKDDQKVLKRTTNKEELTNIKARINRVSSLQKIAMQIQKKASKKVSKIDKANQWTDEKLYKEFVGIKQLLEDVMQANQSVADLAEQALQPVQILAQDMTPIEPSTELPTTTFEQNETNTPVSAGNQTTLAKYTRANDVMLSPPVLKCLGATTEVDPFTGKERRITQEEELFHYTNAFMANVLKDKHHVNCFVSLIEVKKNLYIHFKFVIHDVNGDKNFGPIRNDIPMIVKFVDETKLPLVNSLVDEGTMDDTGSTYTVRASTQLYKLERTAFERMEIDRIRIPWTKGYEEYEVYRVNLVQQLFKCL